MFLINKASITKHTFNTENLEIKKKSKDPPLENSQHLPFQSLYIYIFVYYRLFCNLPFLLYYTINNFYITKSSTLIKKKF